MSHELDLGTLLLIGSDIDAIFRLSLRTNIEAGSMLLRIEIGPSYNPNHEQFGMYAGIGLAKIINAAGGGFF